MKSQFLLIHLSHRKSLFTVSEWTEGMRYYSQKCRLCLEECTPAEKINSEDSCFIQASNKYSCNQLRLPGSGLIYSRNSALRSSSGQAALKYTI